MQSMKIGVSPLQNVNVEKSIYEGTIPTMSYLDYTVDFNPFLFMIIAIGSGISCIVIVNLYIFYNLI